MNYSPTIKGFTISMEELAAQKAERKHKRHVAKYKPHQYQIPISILLGFISIAPLFLTNTA